MPLPGQKKIFKWKQARIGFVRMEHALVGSDVRGVEPIISLVSQETSPRRRTVVKMVGGDVSKVN